MPSCHVCMITSMQFNTGLSRITFSPNILYNTNIHGLQKHKLILKLEDNFYYILHQKLEYTLSNSSITSSIVITPTTTWFSGNTGSGTSSTSNIQKEQPLCRLKVVVPGTFFTRWDPSFLASPRASFTCGWGSTAVPELPRSEIYKQYHKVIEKNTMH